MINIKDAEIRVAKIHKEDVYEILKRKNKRIFDIIKEEEIIVIFSDNQIATLCDILNDNKIKCNREEFETYLWVRFNSRGILGMANSGPINAPCKVYTFDDFINLINI